MERFPFPEPWLFQVLDGPKSVLRVWHKQRATINLCGWPRLTLQRLINGDGRNPKFVSSLQVRRDLVKLCDLAVLSERLPGVYLVPSTYPFVIDSGSLQ